ncbi:MAG: endonuclease/exonuclease/phosphatase family protein [Saprospiraceae bacterium]|nr:endonuclease/exonuclease/phosphatase family protein [Saprospiraceae bacterium]
MRKAAVLFIPFTLIVSLFMIMTLMAPWVSPSSFWPALFAAYAFVYLFPVLILCFIFWLRPLNRWALLPAILLLLSIPALHRHVQWGGTEYTSASPKGVVIATLNAYSLHKLKLDKKDPAQVDRTKSANLFPADMQPDIVCLQEVPLSYQPRGPDWGISNSFLFRHKNSLIVSRYPIDAKGKKSFEGSGNSISWADITTPIGQIRVFNVHLQSNRISQDTDHLAHAPMDEAKTWSGWKKVLRKVLNSTRLREEQARWLANAVQQSPYPTLVAGDFNDTPQSYAYRIIRKGLKDSFEHGGFGFGTTFAGRIPGLRIDFILMSPDLDVINHQVSPVRYSDHYPVLSRVIKAD